MEPTFLVSLRRVVVRRRRAKVVTAKLKCKFAIVVAFLLTAHYASGQKPDLLKADFQSPPHSARPWVWWHWMNGNITQEGIKLDLEWMHRIGLAGFQLFDANLATPQVVDKSVPYMSPEWKSAFKYATTLANRLGLEESIASSPGWSETGGPWVPPSQGMKKYVWSETLVEGGKPFRGKLVHPPSVTGPFQNLELKSMRGFDEPQFYADSAVVAYRPAMLNEIEELTSNVTWSSGEGLPPRLTEGHLADPAILRSAATPGDKAWIQFGFAESKTLRSLSILCRADPDAVIALEASKDGQTFDQIASVSNEGTAQQTVSFPPVSAKYFRVTFKTPPDTDSDGNLLPPSAKTILIKELNLYGEPRVNRFEDKAAFTPVANLYSYPTPEVPAALAIQPDDVLDLTTRLQPDGSLEWTPPPGRWIVLRIGYSLLGMTNHPATKEATGLEVDKLNRAAVSHYMERYLSTYKETVGASMIGVRGIRSVVSDSWEAGAQNWTDDMLTQFAVRRGYDPHPWLPVLSGRIVRSAQASDQFLWDLRKTIEDLTAEAHYGQIAASLQQWGLKHYGESHEWSRAMIADGMEVKKLDDVPMSAMWTQQIGVNKQLYSYDADDREAASVGHIYGKKVVAAESFTAKYDWWRWSPATLKPTADQEFLNGINRLMIHESTHQPLANNPPGLTLGPYGQWFNRYETWGEQAGPWIQYLARSSYMLQRGSFVADLLYFYGEDTNLTSLFISSRPRIPAGYAFDYINADALIHELSVSAGSIATRSGMRYRLLVLDANSRHMSLPVLRAIYQLVEKGGVVVGEKPVDTPSLADDWAEWQRLNDELFGDGSGVRHAGRGEVFAGQDIDQVLQSLQLRADFDYSRESSPCIQFVHRRLSDGHIYFLDNRCGRPVSVDARFRVAGKAPELWYAETGTTEPVAYELSGGRTTIPLRLEPWGTVFVLFRQTAKAKSFALPGWTEADLATISGNWLLRFQKRGGAPDKARLQELQSWSTNDAPAIRYFSGAGSYLKTIDASRAWFKPGVRLWIDLGDVRNLATVMVNGKLLGTAWHTPYRVEVTGALRPGSNRIEIQVVNSWVNHLIGDEQPQSIEKYTCTDISPYTADSPLEPSGMLGPVRLIARYRAPMPN